MFGLSFSELVVILVVGMIVLGPKELPKVLRQAGIWAGKLRRLAADMRAQSGIDDIIRDEGLDRDIAEIRKLARGEIEGVIAATRTPMARAALPGPRNAPAIMVDRDREWPNGGADSYGALPERNHVYEGELAKSALATDPIYTAVSAGSTGSTEATRPAVDEAAS